MSAVAHATLDIPLRDRILYGRGRIVELPHLVRELGARHAFVVTDPGVARAGVAARVREVLEAGGIPTVSSGSRIATRGWTDGWPT